MDRPLVLMSVPADAASISVVRHAMSGVAAVDDWHPAFLADVNVAVTEACENAVLHGYRGRDPGTVAIGVHTDGDDLIVRVADDGDGFPAGDGDREAPGEGVGVMLMLTLTDHLAIASRAGGPTELTMRFRILRTDAHR